MKKALIVILAAMICALPVLAQADIGFLTLASMFMQEDRLGDPSSMFESSEDNPTNACMAIFVIDEETLMITGEDSEGRYLVVTWIGVDSMELLSTLYAMCATYDTIAPFCENGLMIVVHLVEDGEYIYIDSSEKAASMAAVMLSE